MLRSSSSWNTLDGQESVRVHTLAEERGNPLFPNTVLLIESQSVVCHTPEDPPSVVHIICTQRYSDGARPVALQPITDSFVNGVRFLTTGE